MCVPDGALRYADDIPTLVLGCIIACKQCETIAQQLTPEEYTYRRAPHGSIGAHLRHCLEHFQLLLTGLSSGRIEYDARTRNAEVERSSARFLEEMRDVVSSLATFDQASMDTPLNVSVLIAPGREHIAIASTLGRELAFLSSHVVHHLAVMALLADSMGVLMPEGYGVAYSTSAYRSGASIASTSNQEPSLCAR